MGLGVSFRMVFGIGHHADNLARRILEVFVTMKAADNHTIAERVGLRVPGARERLVYERHGRPSTGIADGNNASAKYRGSQSLEIRGCHSADFHATDALLVVPCPLSRQISPADQGNHVRCRHFFYAWNRSQLFEHTLRIGGPIRQILSSSGSKGSFERDDKMRVEPELFTV